MDDGWFESDVEDDGGQRLVFKMIDGLKSMCVLFIHRNNETHSQKMSNDEGCGEKNKLIR